MAGAEGRERPARGAGAFIRALQSVFGVQEGEGGSVGLMIGHSFFLGVSTVFFETAASALFLAKFNYKSLPWVYLVAALLNTMTGLVYTRLKERVSFGTLMTSTLVFLLGFGVAFRVGISLTSASWLIFGLLVWYRVLSILTDLEYWAVAARIYDVRQSKRLYSLIASGEVTARIFGAFSVPLLLRMLNVQDLMIISAAGLGFCLLFLGLILKLYVPKSASAPGSDEGEVKKDWSKLSTLFENRYITMIVLLAVFGAFGKYFIDFAFLQQMQTRHNDAKSLAGFFGLFSGVTQVINLVTTILLSGRIISRYGVRVGLLILPSLQLLCTLGIVVFGSKDPAGWAIFWLIIANQGIYKTLKHPIDNPSFKVLYQPLARDQRLAAQIALEVIVTPITIAMAGAVMLLFSRVMPFDPVRFSWVLVFTFGAWLVSAVFSFREYSVVLVSALKKRILDRGTELNLSDPSSIAIIKGKLQSSWPGDVIYGLALLERSDHTSFVPALLTALGHSSPEVQRYSFSRVEALRPSSGLPAVRARLSVETDSTVRAAALRALCVLSSEPIARHVIPFLSAPERDVRGGAMTGLLLRRDREDVSFVMEHLGKAARSGLPADRAVAARVIGEARVEGAAEILLTLIGDPAGEVRAAAIVAAGRLGDARFAAPLVERFSHAVDSGGAASALLAMGEKAVPALGESFTQRPFRPRNAARAARTLARIPGDAALRLLVEHLDLPHRGVRTQVLAALNHRKWRAEGDDQARVLRIIREEVGEAAWKLACIADVENDPQAGDLISLLTSGVEQNRARVFLFLSFLFDAKAVLRASEHLSGASKEKRAYAVEILDILLPGALKGYVLPLVEDLSPSQRLDRLREVVPQSRLGRDQRLREVILRADTGSGDWTKVFALHLVGSAASEALAPDVEKLLTEGTESPIIVETAAWALGRIKRLGKIDHPGSAAERGTSLLAIEKVIILKSVSIFANTPEDRLPEIASILEEADFKKGERMFEKGDAGKSMYIIVDGKIRIHDGDKVFAVLGERDILGEMAILDDQPRSASATIEEDAHLLRLDRETFYELMTDHIEVVNGVMRVLCERLRKLSALVAAKA